MMPEFVRQQKKTLRQKIKMLIFTNEKIYREK